jgi:ribosomal protein S18 acetylase RimI-like enzyme
MTRAVPWRGARVATELIRVHESRDRRELEAAMSADRAYGAYALAQLDPPLFGRARFWLGERGDGASGLVAHTQGSGRSTMLLGDPLVVRAILALHPGPRIAYLATAAPEHLPALRSTHHVGDRLMMCRMQVTATSFRRAPDSPGEGDPPVESEALQLRRLHGFDVPALNALYRSGGGPSHYTHADVERSLYYGAFAGSRLVAVAGTHVVAAERGVGVVGNVLTHSAYRSRGLATRVTSAVTSELFTRGVALTVLSVDPDNAPAVRVYRRLGYERGAIVVEARLVRRSALGARALWRRFRARRRAERGRAPDGRAEEWIDLRPRERDGAHEGGVA